MAHLRDTRIGWENEHLSAYLLSRISFIANPVTIGDDIGSDFLCTLFEPIVAAKRTQLFPLRSFAIQIKSSSAPLSVDNKIGYLDRLELPFFLGVVDQEDLCLSIFSGQFLPMMLTEIGLPSRLTLDPVQDQALAIADGYTRDPAHCHLRLPYLATLSAREDQGDFDSKREMLATRCVRMQANISTKIAQEYIYRLDDEDGVLIQAGPGSAQTFRRNLYLRLAEAFYNLEWLIAHAPEYFDLEEYAVYADFYKSLSGSMPKASTILDEIAGRLREKVRERYGEDA